MVVLLDAIQQQQIRCKGTVRNRNGDQYGIEFSDLSGEDRELILRCSRASHQRLSGLSGLLIHQQVSDFLRSLALPIPIEVIQRGQRARVHVVDIDGAV